MYTLNNEKRNDSLFSSSIDVVRTAGRRRPRLVINSLRIYALPSARDSLDRLVIFVGGACGFVSGGQILLRLAGLWSSHLIERA